MRIYRTLILTAVAVLASRVVLAQDAPDGERVAGLKYAIANGLALPANLFVASQAYPDSARPRSVVSPAELRASEAVVLAKVAGPAARVAHVAASVTCRRNVCFAKTPTSVLVVSDPSVSSTGATIVHIQVFDAALDGTAPFTQALVQVQKSGSGWVGVGFQAGPNSGKLRIPE